MTKGDQVREVFKKGNANCAQTVLCAFTEETGLSEDTLARIASGFGGGIGRLRGTCGAVSGMCMAAGLLRGHTLGQPDEEKEATYAMIQELVGKFKEYNQSIYCCDLLGGVTSTAPTDDLYATTAKPLRPCIEYMAYAAELLEQYLKDHPLE